MLFLQVKNFTQGGQGHGSINVAGTHKEESHTERTRREDWNQQDDAEYNRKRKDISNAAATRSHCDSIGHDDQ